MRELLRLSNRISEIERRFSQSIRHAPVKEVNAAEGWVRLDLGKGDDGQILSPKIPYAQMAGGLKIHAPPTVGQQMTMFAPGGDPAQAMALPLSWSDQNKTPSDKGDENVLTFGNVRVELRGDEILATIGGFSLSLKASGATFDVGGVTHQITAGGVSTDGGEVQHDGKNIGSSHVHGGVERGGSNTSSPAN